MTDRRKSFTVELKTKVALEAIEGHRTISETASGHGVHLHPITR